MTKPPKRRLTLDFETQSRCDLKKAGAYRYSLDPSTRPTCLAFKRHGHPKIWFLDFKQVNAPFSKCPARFEIEGLIEEGYEFSAHNAFFERCIYTNILVKRYGWPEIPIRQWRCTAAKAAACALPRSLAGAGEAMMLDVQKDPRGYSAMMATCKPTKEWVAWKKKIGFGAHSIFEPPVFLPQSASDTWNTLYEYCRIDVLAEEALDDALPDLSPIEQELWHLNQEINWRGLRVDVPTITKIVSIMKDESSVKLEELDRLTMGLVEKPGSRQDILDFLALEGVKIDNLRAQTVDDKLRGFELSSDMHRLLELRRALSVTSTRKYQKFLDRVNEDDRVRDIILFHGASTGRDSGTGVQPQNFPKGLIHVEPDRPYAAIENIIECDAPMLKLLYGENLSILFSAVLRNMIIPTRGCELFVADFAKIEVAVCWWLAGNTPGLKVLQSGGDPYIYQAMANTRKPADEINFNDRQLAKAQVLGAQFGMGAPKFRQTAWDMYRLKLTEEESVYAIQSYRTVNAAVPALWKAYEAAAVSAVEAPPSMTVSAYCSFTVRNDFLWVTLPSGRMLAYRRPQIAWRESEYGPRKTLEFWAVNSKTKKWALERTWGGTLTENIVQGAARDLLMYGMLRLEKAGYRALLTVHDEAICERRTWEGNVKEFIRILCEQPSWAPGLPIEAKGWKGPRYRK